MMHQFEIKMTPSRKDIVNYDGGQDLTNTFNKGINSHGRKWNLFEKQVDKIPLAEVVQNLYQPSGGVSVYYAL